MNKKVIFISWAPYCSRSDNIARELGGKSYMVYCGFLGSNYYTIIFKYFFQTIQSLYILFRDRPKLVVVMSPPIFACIPVWLYCFFFKQKYLIDAHTGSLLDRIHIKIRFIHRFFSKYATRTIVTDKRLVQILEAWKVESMIIPDVPVKFNKAESNSDKEKYLVTVINTFSRDEPLEAILDAVSKFGNLKVFITGNIRHDLKKYSQKVYENITFTGFLSEVKYKSLLTESDFIITITTGSNNMQRGGYEAIYCEKPLITSDWPLLRDNFFKGTVFYDNSSDGLKHAIETLLNKFPLYKKEALELKSFKLKNWENNKKQILNLL